MAAASMVLANVFGGWGVVELGILMMIGLLIFGKRLPEVGRGLGKSIMEFKKGMTEVASPATNEIPADATVVAVGTRRTTAELPPGTSANDTQNHEERIAKLTAELQALQQEVAKQRESHSA